MLPGTRFGAYEIVAPLGAGGMGEVYRARDPRLQRDVALKLLPASVAADPERLARFTREAQLLAAINHPNIGAIHGLEKVGALPSLVLELVEGPTLAERIAEGPIPLDDAIAIARQVADALEYAHEQGIIHRDLKPANIKIRPDGTVKVLDFGLGKALGGPGSQADRGQDLAQSPTLTHNATAHGVILGTAAYMAPEQARGRLVDRRVDIWSFGVVLFEMLAGSRPFGGETISESMAAIIKDAPEWRALPASTPEPITQLLRRTLEKDPKQRLRDIGDARLVLEDVQRGTSARGETPVTPTPPPPPPPMRWMTWVPWAIALASLVGVVFLVQRRQPGPAPSSSTPQVQSQGRPGPVQATELPALKYSLPIPNLQVERTLLPALSPDGRRIVYGRSGQLWMRELDKLEPRPLAGTTGAQYPFWSADSRQVAYLTANALWRVPIDGSPPVRIAPARFSKGGRTPGGVWRADGTIVFAPAALGSGFMGIPGEGGEFREIIARDPKGETDFHKPSLLPDGESMLFVTDRIDHGADTIEAIVKGKRKTILQLTGDTLDSPVYSATGHILYQRETTTPGIWAVPFSLERLETTGTPFLVVPDGSWPAMGANGLLVYAESELTGLEELVWLDLVSGSVTVALKEQFNVIGFPRLSPDGRRVAAVVHSPEVESAVIVADLERHTRVTIADRAARQSRPAWRDDRTILYGLDSGQTEHIAMRRADASQPEVDLFRGMHPSIAAGRLVFTRLETEGGGGLWHAEVPPDDGKPSEPRSFQQTPPHETEPMLSPDGTLLAYTRGDFGQSEVMLRRYPDGSDQWQVSTAGGTLPLWNRSGDKLYFRDTPGQIFVVDVKRRPPIALSAPRPVPRAAGLIARLGFDISRDGKRLLMTREVKTENDRGPSLAIVQNWLADFRRR